MGKNLKKQTEEVIAKADIPALLKIVEGLDEDVRKIVDKTIKTDLTDVKKKKALAEIKNTVSLADGEVKTWLVGGIAEVYVEGMKNTDKVLHKYKIKTPAGKLTIATLKGAGELAPQLEAVNALIGDAYLDFGSSMTGMVKSTEHIFNDVLKQQSRAVITEGRLVGKSIREIAKEVSETIGQKGFSVLIDRGGNKWTLPRYSKMLARTHLVRANNEATVNRSAEFGVDIVEVSSHGTTTPICIPYEGKKFSISGKSKNYPLLTNTPPFHPNCKHSLLPRPDLE